MPKAITRYKCQSCGYITLRWMGKCPECGKYNSIVEEVIKKHTTIITSEETIIPLSEVSLLEGKKLSTGLVEFDRVLGGGIVPGSVVLIGGDPGIGKSTLLLQVMERVLKSNSWKGLYVSAEESSIQIKLRAIRLGINSNRIFILTETRLERIISEIESLKPAFVVIDSIQTVYSSNISSIAGTVSQVRECSAKITVTAKKNNIPIFIIGHVTKEGAIAGPRVLEHIVDTVLYFEGDRFQTFRLLRAVKNRFGSTNEVGVFEMTDSGLKEITNPSELFLSGNEIKASGNVLTVIVEGTRPIIVEIQALVTSTTFGMPRRTSIGVDSIRVNLLIAVLEKIGGLQLGLSDIYVNVVGGLKIFEPSVDLPVITAIASSFKNILINRDMVIIGEVGLSGEIRPITHIELRLKEAKKMGIKKALIPIANLPSNKINSSLDIIGMKNIKETLEIIS